MYRNIISIIAKGTNSGKTYIMERLIAEFKKRGKKVTAVKHSAHFHTLDKTNKDTYKYAQQGADRIMLFAEDGLLMYETSHPDIEHISGLASKDIDIVLVEGFKAGPFKKIEVFNETLYDTPLCIERPSPDYIALISHTYIDAGIPCFDFNDLNGICKLIEGHIIK